MLKSLFNRFFSIIPAALLLLILFSPSITFALGLPNFTELVKQHSPAVVNISTSSKSTPQKPYHVFPMPKDRSNEFNDLFRRFFDDEIPEDRDSSSLGSGFILSSDGYILTNHHVISGADEIIVKLSDRRELVARLVGSDMRSDIALIKVDATDLPVLKTAEPDELEVGEWVVAIGSPFGFDHSVTAGIVSAKGRSLPTDSYVPFIQTDVAINPGNSGGPLFNLKGEVVGVNSQIYSRTGGFMGLSFAIPIGVAMDVVEQLKTKGKVSRGWLGIVIQEVTRDLAKSFQMKEIRGALVAQVLDKSSAKGVLRGGDIIIEFDGKSVDTVSALPVIVGRTTVGKEVDVKVLRNGKEKRLKLTIAELPENLNKAAGKKTEKAPEKEKKIALGMIIQNLDDAVRKALKINSGVLVHKVKPGPAAEAGIVAGDVISMVAGKPIENTQQFIELAKGFKKGDVIPVLVKREGAARFVALKIE